MKNSIVILFFFFSISCLNAQDKAADTIRYSFELDSIHRAEFENFEMDFNKWFFKTYCPRHKIKISCAGCSRFRLRIFFTVDTLGKTLVLNSDKGNFCGSDLSEKRKTELLKGLERFKFSAFFYGKIILFDFNRTLKC